MVVRARCPGLLYFSNFGWFLVKNYIKNMEYTGDRKFIEVYVCQNVVIDEVLTKLLRK